MRQIFLILIITYISNSTIAQIKWDDSFTTYICQLNSTSPIKSEYSDLAAIDDLIADKKIIALGEATHGTKEFFTTKHRLIQYLVEKHDFKIIVIEDGYTSTHNIDDFISGENNTEIEKLLSRNWSGAWRTQEVLDMVLWIKSYNTGKDESERIRIYGCDMKWYMTPAKYILSELNDSEHIDVEIQKTLKFIANHRRSNKMTKKEKDDIKLLLDKLNEIEVEKNVNEFKFNVRILEQSLDYLWTKSSISRTILRDRYMAENCQRIFDAEKERKMIVWAHNQHVANHSDVSKKKPMGAHLKQYFEDKYYSIGFNFYTGEYWAYNPEIKKNSICNLGLPKEDCIDNFLAMAPFPNYFIDINNRNLPEELSELFNNSSWSRRAGPFFIEDNNAKTNYRKCVLSESYDMLVFIRNTSAVKQLPYTP
ncbi:erythromycin esterase family protein [Carboxylicivirga taeanensis]|uniref:erythromycin esterase family protein n=1 Tax=Carboxylicivirga taeanensis TaxID=1416875 RepID=UPI003F6DBD58